MIRLHKESVDFIVFFSRNCIFYIVYCIFYIRPLKIWINFHQPKLFKEIFFRYKRYGLWKFPFWKIKGVNWPYRLLLSPSVIARPLILIIIKLQMNFHLAANINYAHFKTVHDMAWSVIWQMFSESPLFFTFLYFSYILFH